MIYCDNKTNNIDFTMRKRREFSKIKCIYSLKDKKKKKTTSQ
jgi:hypothetical protein